MVEDIPSWIAAPTIAILWLIVLYKCYIAKENNHGILEADHQGAAEGDQECSPSEQAGGRAGDAEAASRRQPVREVGNHVGRD